MMVLWRILLVILLISSSCADGVENRQLPSASMNARAGGQYGRRTPRKITNNGHSNRNNAAVGSRFNYNPVFVPSRYLISPSPTPASFANSEYVLGRNSQLNNIFRFQPITSTPKPLTTSPKPIFRFGEANDPRVIWNWLLAQTPSRATTASSPLAQFLPSPLSVPESSTPSPYATSNLDNTYSYSYVSSTPAPFVAQKSHPVVVYHQDFQSERLPQYVASPGPVEETTDRSYATSEHPAHPQDYIIATTAKPFIETDLRENFRPFLNPQQLEDYKDGYSYEQNSIAVSTTQQAPYHFEERTTARPSPPISALPKPYRKKVPQPRKLSRLDPTNTRYSRPLFRESLHGAETGRNYETAAAPLDVADSIPQASTVSYVNDDQYSEGYSGKIVPVSHQKPATDYEDEIRGNEIESSSGEYGRYDYPYSNVGYGAKEKLVSNSIDQQVLTRPSSGNDETSSGNGDYDVNAQLPAQNPGYGAIPYTSFNCSHQLYKGPFADTDTGCQVWHYCDLDGRQSSFLCPNGTLFDQRSYTCDWWYNVRCGQSAQLYALNERLFKYRVDEPPQFPFDYHGPQVDQYILQQYLKNLQDMRKKLWGEEGRRARIKEKLREEKRRELIRKLNLELDEETYQKYGFLLRRRRESA